MHCLQYFRVKGIYSFDPHTESESETILAKIFCGNCIQLLAFTDVQVPVEPPALCKNKLSAIKEPFPNGKAFSEEA